jgi:hypothetical protein
MKALVSTIEPVKTGFRIAQVEQDENIFSVAVDLFWIDCPDNTVADQYFYEPSTQEIIPVMTFGLQSIEEVSQPVEEIPQSIEKIPQSSEEIPK